MPYPRRVFLVEDNPVMRRSLIAALAPFAELDVVAFANTEDSALQWLAAHGGDIDIVVLDMVLAGGSGLGVLQGMRQRGIRRDVVVLSNHDTPDMRRRCEALGAAAFFDKTQQNEEFLDYLRTMPVSSGVR